MFVKCQFREISCGHYDSYETDTELVFTDYAVVLKQDSTGQICEVLKTVR